MNQLVFVHQVKLSKKKKKTKSHNENTKNADFQNKSRKLTQKLKYVTKMFQVLFIEVISF